MLGRESSSKFSTINENSEDHDVVRCRRLRWFGHVGRKEDNDWMKACRDLEVEGVKGKGGTDHECVGKMCRY